MSQNGLANRIYGVEGRTGRHRSEALQQTQPNPSGSGLLPPTTILNAKGCPVNTRSITIMLVYEPATSHQGPVPLARIDNPKLALIVARSAISEAEARAERLSDADEFLGEVE